MNRRTKIVTTIGPASCSKEIIEKFFDLGVNVFRLNFSHGKHEIHSNVVDIIRKIESEKKRHVAILADLQGPKLRIGKLESSSINLVANQKISLDLKSEIGNTQRIPFPHPEVMESLEIGHRLLLDDGKIELKVVDVSQSSLTAIVVVPGKISDNKGVNIPDTSLKRSPLTKKDLDDIEFIKKLDVDYIAQSFVQSALDVKSLKALVGDQFKIVAKIEKPQALQDIDEIIKVADAIMVARGDLGVEMDLAYVPVAQKTLIAKARANFKPVIVATQMLESMISASSPTRAEVSDVANAVFDGADAVMLSAESAAGAYPCESVTIMDKIIKETESSQHHKVERDFIRCESITPSEAIAAAAYQLAENFQACAVVCSTITGATAMRVSHFRGYVPIYAMTPNLKTARSLSLVWGVTSYVCSEYDQFDHLIKAVNTFILSNHIAQKGEKAIITGGNPVGRVGQTDLIQVLEVGS
ncbi:MAG: pyruvate kinase [Rickettsiales bacterium]|nr:pyruvate kinase [Rickettsiales bacterium]|tara:strand:+ start:36631 stop:38040 length:1410 start_codon:yes stop_codon:yes gene_type:complete